ncbi:MAG: molybdopterin-dependent oxidoreductase [Oxalobacteraceae bacterium]|nr:molybdopterin-dependent oxidoreductase [Oxalobacteraceae bacterium]
MAPAIGGKVKSFDATKAKSMPGVIDVVKIADGYGEGTEGLAVVADSHWHALKARKALKVEWDGGKNANLSTAEMWKTTMAAEKSVTPIKIRPDVGDANGAIAGAKKVVKAMYQTPIVGHQPLEPMNMIADVKGDKCELTGPTQFQQGAQGMVAGMLGVPPENVSVRTTYLGGGFGRRVCVDYAVQAAAISKAVGRPVRMLWTREDDMKHDFYRPLGIQRMEAGLGADGKPVGLKFQLSSQSITQVLFGLPKNTLDPFMVEAAVAPYAIPSTSHDLIIHDTGIRVGAHAAGKDPVEYRLSLLENEPRFANVLKIAAEKAGWGKKMAKGRSLGVALMEGYGTYMAQVAEISMSGGDVKVHKVTVACDCGHMVNPGIVEQQLESGIIYGLSHALYSENTVEKGRIVQSNFNDFRVLRQNESPVIDITLVKSSEKPGGTGEPSTSLIGAAVGNAIFAASGKRVRSMPLVKGLKSA